MQKELENRMADDSQWRKEYRPELPICYCCDDPIRQEKALHIYSGGQKIWMCDRCINDYKERTGYY